MSYNVNSTEVLSGSLKISRANLKKVKALKVEAPEDSFLEELFDLLEQDETQKTFEIDKLHWRGEGSGYAFSDLVKKILPLTEGSMDVVLVWEGGDSIDGLRIVDGKVTRHEVEKKLGKVLR